MTNGRCFENQVHFILSIALHISPVIRASMDIASYKNHWCGQTPEFMEEHP